MAQISETTRTQSVASRLVVQKSTRPWDSRLAFDRSDLGIAFYLLAIVSMALMDACAKSLVQSYPVGQVAFFRCLFAFLPIALLILHGGGVAALATQRQAMHAVRGVIMIIAIFLFFYALKFLLLAEATAIFFAGPLFMVILSVALLGERVPRSIWFAVFIGFVGVLIMLRPGNGILRVEAFWALGAAFFYALAMITTRTLTRTESILSIVVYGNLVALLVSAFTLPFAWITPTFEELGVFVLIGVFGGLSTLFFVEACYRTRVSVLAPFDYTALIWAAVLGFLFWHELPDIWILLGTAIVVTMGLYVWRAQIGGNIGSSQGKFS